MITAQDIREKTFEKAKFGGYAMNEVDDFLDEVANDLAAIQKEYGILRGKMKVLVGKIEEYRSNEDAMHMALVSAQKIAGDIESGAQTRADAVLAEAQAKADAIVAEAQAKADEVCGNLEARRAEEELRLQKAKASASEFIHTMLSLTEKERALLSTLKDMDLSSAIVTPAPAEKKAIAAPEEEFAVPSFGEAEEEPLDEIVPEESVPDYVKAFEDAVYQPEIPEADDADAAPEFVL